MNCKIYWLLSDKTVKELTYDEYLKQRLLEGRKLAIVYSDGIYIRHNNNSIWCNRSQLKQILGELAAIETLEKKK